MAKQKPTTTTTETENTEEKKGGKKVVNPLTADLFNVIYTVNGATGRCRVTVETNDEFDDDTHGNWCESGEVFVSTFKDFATAVEAVEAKIAELCE